MSGPFHLTELTHRHYFFKSTQGLLDLMIAEEEELKERLLKRIKDYLKELNTLCMELQMPPFEVQSHLGLCGCFS